MLAQSEKGLQQSEGTILKSENLGNNWSLIFSGTIYDLNAIFFINENTGYAGGDGFNGYNILKTTNGGQYWYKQRFVNNSTEISSIYFLDSNVGFAAGSVCLFKTTDNGLNWNLYTPLFNGALNDIKFINASTGYIVGGGIYKTTNTGLYWSLIDSSYSFYNLQFVDTQVKNEAILCLSCQ